MDPRTKLLVSNVPADCTEDVLSRWVEARGFRVFKLDLIRDVVSGTSPGFAYVQLMDESRLDEAARTLDRQQLGTQKVHVSRVVPLSSVVRISSWLKPAV